MAHRTEDSSGGCACRGLARNLIDAGVDPFTAMDIAGHTTISMAKA